ncbi:hypothetical protein DdX_05250 [Ditylenchus destructor]|uniref:Borealin n=1 Tax=Ditylenchus destructor TaxID=166010 RepID=A0AAD4NAM2_9BILA|nr:hypothetical protein DdX_05250 [Ditylenchus destructor]
MVRAKKKPVIDPEREAEVRSLLEQFREKFECDLEDLKKAKWDFSNAYVEAQMAELEKSIPNNILNMNANYFVQYIKDTDANMSAQLGSLALNGDNGEEKAGSSADNYMKTPTNRHRNRPFRSIKTPSGVSFNVPSIITPRVDGAVLRSRTSRAGEVLFSVNGTPVMNPSELAPQTSSETKKAQTKVVEQLLQQSETDMSPATRKIVEQLRVVLVKKTVVVGNNENQENLREIDMEEIAEGTPV